MSDRPMLQDFLITSAISVSAGLVVLPVDRLLSVSVFGGTSSILWLVTWSLHIAAWVEQRRAALGLLPVQETDEPEREQEETPYNPAEQRVLSSGAIVIPGDDENSYTRLDMPVSQSILDQFMSEILAGGSLAHSVWSSFFGVGIWSQVRRRMENAGIIVKGGGGGQ